MFSPAVSEKPTIPSHTAQITSSDVGAFEAQEGTSTRQEQLDKEKDALGQ